MKIISTNPITVIFELSDIDTLRKNIKGSFPQANILYKVTDTRGYALYEHNSDTWRHSSLVSNDRLVECINFLQSNSKSDLLKEFAKEQNIPVVDIKLQQPTDEQLQRAIDKIAAKSYIDNLRNTHVFINEFNDPSVMTSALSDINLNLYEPVPEINSGGACDYYRVGVTHPMSKDQVPYIAECGDIMESLEMTNAEVNIFKEIWRSAAERTLGLKKAGNTNVRAAEKVVFFANRYYQQNVHQANITDSRVVFKKK